LLGGVQTGHLWTNGSHLFLTGVVKNPA
jgi:hypothetical protein